MIWSLRQQEILAEMGLKVWRPQPAILKPSASTPVSAQGRPIAQVSAPSGGRQPPAVSTDVPSARARLQKPAPMPPAHEMLIHQEPVASRGRPGLEKMDWAAIKQAVGDCRACKLCENRTQAVFGGGAPQAPWLIVGEAPGEQEDQLGEPFVGKSGQLLDNMLQAIQLSRQHGVSAEQPGSRASQVYITHAVKCRPPGNRNPEPEELAQCQPFLIRQIELLKPRIILAMGRFAVQALLQSQEPIGRLRGRVHHCQGVPLIVTYHPAYLLRNPEDKAKSWADLCLAYKTARH